MKVLLINGSPHENGCTYTALWEISRQLLHHGIESEIFWIGKKPIAGCTACGACKGKGRCAFGENDGVNACVEKMRQADAIVVGSPVYYGGPNGALLSLLDRVFYTAGREFALKPAAAVVSCRRGGASAAFDRLNKYFTISSMLVVGSQYWNSVHGNTPEEVRRDEEGMQVMRTLAENLAWLLGCLQAGADTVEKPVYEPRIATNFIR